MEQVDKNGISYGVRVFDIDATTTIGDICAMYDSKNTQVVKIKNGRILGVVASNTTVAALIDDGYSYRLDEYKSSDCHPGDDKFYVCVKFIGNSPAERKQTPLLIKIQNGGTTHSVGLHVGLLADIPVMNFAYFFGSNHQSKPGHVKLLKPTNYPKTIGIISIDLNIPPA